MTKIYKIFPSIGIARLGNSPDEYFIGPEAPGIVPPGKYRDTEGQIKRQGARFRIYEYEVDQYGGATIQREVTANDATIDWSVHLVNSKAAGKQFPISDKDRNSGCDREGLTIDGGKHRISGKHQAVGPLEGDITFLEEAKIKASANVKLGDLKTDDVGRLIVLGGHGKSASPLCSEIRNFASNNGWYDDVSDGPVTATIKIGNETFDAIPAWVVVASPAYAPGIDNMMTWYDQAVNVDASCFHPHQKLARPSFTKDIYPILKRTVFLQWVHKDARRGHGTGARGDFMAKVSQLNDKSEANKPQRECVFGRLIQPNSPAPAPEDKASYPTNMPKLYSGVNPSNPFSAYIFPSLTQHQYLQMEKWKDGDFDADWSGSEPCSIPFDKLPLDQQPHALTQAALEACIGGPFFPGIETTYLMTLPETYSAPFRIDPSHKPGYLTEHMALPWQADFNDCGAFWWPAQRPVSVKVGDSFKDYSRGIHGYSGMVKHWSDLGFIVEQGDEYVETERLPINGQC
ncbi:MAG: 3-isopropylmalate dehydrogenase [Symploca sp. SIO2E6]|nr:3-isopropylmalate dehydrogenase [Symploca sp. SIO2E6]